MNVGKVSNHFKHVCISLYSIIVFLFIFLLFLLLVDYLKKKKNLVPNSPSSIPLLGVLLNQISHFLH